MMIPKPKDSAAKSVLCRQTDLIPDSGICVEFEGQQIALFYFPDESEKIYGVGNWDPVGKANVLSRGIVGDINERLVVASPLYKQHFDLESGQCLEYDDASVPVYSVELQDDLVLLSV